MANTYLHRTPSSTTNRRTWTWSAWIKRSNLTNASNGHTLWETEGSNGGDNFIFQIKGSNDTVHLHTYGNDVFTTTRKLRDTNGWYHIVLAIDTTQATATNRIKLYINGELQTITQAPLFPSQNFEFGINKNHKHCIGSHGNNANYYFDGLMSHIHFADGTQYDASVFGETDATTGEWKIKTSPSFTLGTNGFTVLKDGNTVTDQSTNSNHFSLGGGTLTNSLDCPSNIMCTLNPLWTQESTRVPTLTLGNNMFSGGSSSTWYQTIGTLGFSSGKYYWEAKYNAGTNLGKNLVGAVGIDGMTDGKFYEKTPSIFYKNEDGGEYRLNNSQSSGNYGTLAQNDILGCAIDMDASTPTATFYKNGTALVSNISLTGFAGKTIVPAVSTYSSGEFQMNFGNGSFGGTALTGTTYSGADGSSTFQYEPPTGHSAVSTKGLNA